MTRIGLLAWLCVLLLGVGRPAWADLPSNISLRDPGDPPYQELSRRYDYNGRAFYLSVHQYYGERTWAAYVMDLVTRALPVLEQQMGFPVPYDTINVYEARESSEGVVGSASGALLRLAPDASEHTVLHELAHLWLDFNYHEHWVREGFADFEAYRGLMALGIPTTAMQGRELSFQQRCGARDWPLALWNRSARLDAGCGYGKSAVFAGLLHQVLGEQVVQTILQRLYADAIRGRSFQEELMVLYPGSRPDNIARLFSGWVNHGAYFFSAPRF